jgi:alpha-tubulin suppressor-like RCC1 family protein
VRIFARDWGVFMARRYRYLGVFGWAGLLVAGAAAGCSGSNGGSGANGSDDASMDAGDAGDATSDDADSGMGTGLGSMDSGPESGTETGGQNQDATTVDSGNPVEAGGGSDAAEGGSPPVEAGVEAGTEAGAVDGGDAGDAGTAPGDGGGEASVSDGGDAGTDSGAPADGGDAGVPDAGEAGIPAAGCETAIAGNYVATSQGHLFATGGNAASSAWTPITVTGGAALDHVVSVAHSSGFACALRDDHTVWCWAEQSSAAVGGVPTSGQIGDGTTTWPATAYVATEVQTAAGPTYLAGITSLTGDGENFYARPFCAVDTAGKVWCWGPTHPNGGGSTLLINSVSSSTYSAPYAVAIAKSATAGDVLTGVAQVASGTNQMCVILTTGQVECWGSNTYGALGTATADGGSTSDSDYPVPVVGLPSSPGATQISVGNGTICAVVGGEAYCWGSSGYDETGTGRTPGLYCLGIGHYCDPPGSPVVQLSADGGAGGPLTNVSYVYSGYDFGCALTGAGALYCWGAGPSSNALGAIPLALTGGGTATSVTHVSSNNSEDYAHVSFSLADGTYYTDTSNHAVISCK